LFLLYAGRLTHEKGAHTAVEAVGRLATEHGWQNVRLLLVGSGPKDYETYLYHLRSSLKIEGQVEIRKWVPREEMPNLMRQFDVLVLPSIIEEALPRIVQEAMATGLVVVGTLTGGTREILVDGVNGLAFAPGDAQGLVAQIVRLAAGPGLRQELSRAGRQMVEERFSLPKMVDQLETYFSLKGTRDV
jgi:glycosyltransferase involved in cell wall biosynthesis